MLILINQFFTNLIRIVIILVNKLSLEYKITFYLIYLQLNVSINILLRLSHVTIPKSHHKLLINLLNLYLKSELFTKCKHQTLQTSKALI